MNVPPMLTVWRIPIVLTLLMVLSVSVHSGLWVTERSVEMVALLMSVRRLLIVLKMPLVLTLLMDLSVSVCQDSLVMVKPLEMDAGVRVNQLMTVFADIFGMTLII